MNTLTETKLGTGEDFLKILRLALLQMFSCLKPKEGKLEKQPLVSFSKE